jgi:hypothetical protein
MAMYEGSGTAVGDQAQNNASEGTLSGSTIPTWSGVNDTGLKFAGGADLASYVTFGSVAAHQDIFNGGSGSVYIKARMGATNIAGGLVGRNDNNATTRGWNLSLTAGPKIEFAKEASANYYATVPAPAANTDFDLLWTYNGTLPGAATDSTVYINGSSQTVTLAAAGNTPQTSDSADPLKFGTTSGFSTAGSFDGYLYLVYIWKGRIITSSEYTSLNADPYQLYAASSHQQLLGNLFVGPMGLGR